MPEDMSEYMPEDMSDRMPEDMSEYMPEDMPDRMPEDMSDRVPEDMPDRMPEDLPDRMPEDMPEDMPDHMPEDMPDRMSNRMSEDMSDRMPEDLPVRKCINVMVGITRSKVIFIGLYKPCISCLCIPWKNPSVEKSNVAPLDILGFLGWRELRLRSMTATKWIEWGQTQYNDGGMCRWMPDIPKTEMVKSTWSFA